MADYLPAHEPPLPNWPILLGTVLAARYLSLDEHSFGIVAAKAGVRPVDLGLPLIRWRRSELDRLVAKLPNSTSDETAPRATDPDQAEILVQRIVQGVASRMAAHPSKPPAQALSLKDAAKTIGISRATLYRMVNDGRLPTVRIGSRVLVKRADIEALLDQPIPTSSARKRGRPRKE
jgi:excisionase family DNA binding protein